MSCSGAGRELSAECFDSGLGRYPSGVTLGWVILQAGESTCSEDLRGGTRWVLRSVPTLLSDVAAQAQGASAHSVSPWPGQFFKVSWLGLVAAVVLTGLPSCPLPCFLQQDSAILSCIPVTYWLMEGNRLGPCRQERVPWF